MEPSLVLLDVGGLVGGGDCDDVVEAATTFCINQTYQFK
jgi:hypothetical protein